jgi:hypothetical protein
MATVNDDYPTKKSTTVSDADLKALAIAKHAQTNTETNSTPESKFPTEVIELPSRGILYPKGSELATGKIEMKYMTAREEDILTNQSYIKQGIVLDKLFKALIVSNIDYHDLLLGDKNAIMIAARILGYGKDYDLEVMNPSGESQKITVDLTKLGDKEIDWKALEKSDGTFIVDLPASKRQVTVQLLTHGIQKKIDSELKGLTKLRKDAQMTTLLKHLITSVDGDAETKTIRHFVDNELFAIDARAIRTKVSEVTPDINLEVDCIDEEDGEPFRSTVSIGLDFFWPDSKL